MSEQCGRLIRYNDLMSIQLEFASQRAKCAPSTIPLQKDINEAMTMQLHADDIADVYLAPRVSGIGSEFWLAEAWSLDQIILEEDGRRLDFCKFRVRKKAFRKVVSIQTTLLSWSPMCTNFAAVMNSNWGRFGEAEKQRRLREVRVHFESRLGIRRKQREAGRQFLHEHSSIAASWGKPGVMNSVGMDT